MKKDHLLKRSGILLALFGFLCVFNIKAQTWTAPTFEHQTDDLSSHIGEVFYLYNVGLNAYVTYGSNYGTRAVMGPVGYPMYLRQSGTNYKFEFVTSPKHNGATYNLFRASAGNVYTDNTINADWTCTYDVTSKSYNVASTLSATTYLAANSTTTNHTANAGNGFAVGGKYYHVVDNSATNNDYAKWRFVTPKQKALLDLSNLFTFVTNNPSLGIDLTSYIATYNNAASTVTDLTTAFATLKNAIYATASASNPVDISSFTIANPSFEFKAASSVDSWVVTAGTLKPTYSAEISGTFPNAGSCFIEYYQGSGNLPAFNVQQTISALPAGKYSMKAIIKGNKNASTTPANFSLFAGSNSTNITSITANTATQYEVQNIPVLSDGSSLNIGLQYTTGANWLAVDNFQLYYYGPAPLLSASASSISFAGTKTSSFTVSSNQASAVTLTAPAGITLSTYSIPANPSPVSVDVTYDGNTTVADTIRLTCGELITKIAVSAHPTLTTSTSSIAFEGNTSSSFTVSSSQTSDVTLSAPAGITLSTYLIPANPSAVTVNVTYDGLTSVADNIVLTCGALVTNVTVRSYSTACFTPLYPTGNIVQSPYMNSFTGFSNWGKVSIVTGAEAYCGSSCGKITGTGDCYPNGGSISKSITWKPNTVYRERAMVKTVDGAFAMGHGKTYTVNSRMDGNFVINIPQTTSAWIQIDTTFTTGALAGTDAFYFANCDATGTLGRTAYIDNWELYALPSWNGTGNWNTAANWGGSVPSAGADIHVLSGTLTINENISVANVTIAPGAALILNSGNTLSVSGNFVIKSDAAGTGLFVDANVAGGLTVGGTSTVQQYLTGADSNVDGIPDGQYWYLTSPVVGANSSIFSPSATANRLWAYNEAGGATSANVYSPITVGTEVLNAGKGYVARLTGNTTVNFTGTALVNGAPTIDLTYTPTSGKPGFNLIGNPYPSYLNIRSALNDVVEVEKGIWYRSLAGGIMGFDTYNITDSTQVKHDGGTTVLSSLVPPMQAFWVKATATKTITLSNAMRTHRISGNLLRSSNAEMQKIRLNISNGVHTDETLIGFYSDASDEFDNHDSRKLFNGVAALPEIYTLAGSTEVAINGLSPFVSDREIKLGFNTMQAGTFTIKATELLNMEEGQSVFLNDKLLNVSQNLVEMPDYSFTSTAMTNTDRFSLMIGKSSTALSTVNNPVFAVCTANGSMLEVSLSGMNTNLARIVVLNALGQELASYKATGFKTVIDKHFESGVYMVKVVAPGFQATRKLIINN